MTALREQSIEERRDVELGSILYSEQTLDDWGNHDKSRIEFPMPKFQAIEMTKGLTDKQIIHINNQSLDLEKAINFLVGHIKDGLLEELEKRQITDDIYSLYYRFEPVTYEIKYREVE